MRIRAVRYELALYSAMVAVMQPFQHLMKHIIQAVRVYQMSVELYELDQYNVMVAVMQ